MFDCPARGEFIAMYFQLTVSVVPSIKEGSQVVSANVKQPAVLECIVSGVPPPRVTWRKHGVILSGNSPR